MESPLNLSRTVAALAVAFVAVCCTREQPEGRESTAAPSPEADGGEEKVDWQAARAMLNESGGMAPQVKPASERTQTFNSLPAKTALVRVGGSTLTKQDVLDEISLMAALRTHSTGKGLKDKEYAAIRQGVRQRAAASFVSRELAYLTARTNVSEEALADAAQALKARYEKRFCREGESIEALFAALDDREAAHLRRIIERETAIEAAIRQHYPSNLVVTAEEIKSARTRVEEWNRMVAATNAQSYAMATNLLNAARRGANFEDMADKYSAEDDKQPGGLVEQPTDADFCNGSFSYLPELNRLRPGEVSRILETNEGLQIVQCVKHDALTDERTFRRIVLPLGVTYAADYATDENLTRIGLRQGRDAAMQELISAARQNAKPWYMEGPNFIAK